MKTIDQELARAWNKAMTIPGKLELFKPSDLEPQFAARIIIDLLQQTYVNHGISQDPVKVETDILQHSVDPFIVTRNRKAVACAALVHQIDGSVEIGRAVSIERGSGAGKVAMLEAVQSKGSAPLVAEVRLAGEFADVPGSEATQRICFNIMELVPHAFLPAFGHGSPFRLEMFGFSAEHIKLIDHRPILTATATIVNRCTNGNIGRLKIVQEKPFRVAVRDDNGRDIMSVVNQCREVNSGFSLIPLEVTDRNLPTINALLNNQFIIAGLDKVQGPENKPIIWLTTVGKNTIIAPTQPSDCLHTATIVEICQTAEIFNQLSQGE